MFATFRRIALAIAGAAALVAAGRARADPFDDLSYPPAPGDPVQGYQVPAAQAPGPVLRFSLVLPAPPTWLGIAPPPPPAYRTWTRVDLDQQYRWLDLARARFDRHGAWSPWQVRQFEGWYQARHAALDRCLPASAWAPAPGYGWREGWRGGGWRGGGWHGHGQGWARGRWEHERRDRDD